MSEMTGYRVWVSDGDERDGEYSGITHTSVSDARRELSEAEAEPGVYIAWIKEVPLDDSDSLPIY